MMQEVFLVVGVPGSGKSWVCEQLTQRFEYVKHDEHINSGALVPMTITAALGDKPVLLDCPFGERLLRGSLEAAGLKVEPFFIVEPTEVVQARYMAQRGKELPKASVTRSVTIQNRAIEWGARHGTADEVLRMLSEIPIS